MKFEMEIEIGIVEDKENYNERHQGVKIGFLNCNYFYKIKSFLKIDFSSKRS